jgi:hypothetical protein
LTIPTKDFSGVFRMTPLYGTQRYFLDEIATGLEAGVHDFLVLKGRQQGITTITDALDLYWPQKFDNVQAMMIADDDPNLKVRRAILRQMFYSLPIPYRLPIHSDNEGFLEWNNGSRLMFAAAASRVQGSRTKLGRGRGASYIHADEFDAWTDTRAVKGLRASRSDRNPTRLYTWASTAQGHGVLWDTWKASEHSPTTRRIFIPWFMHDHYRIEQDNRAVWDAYGREDPSEEERLWLRAVDERYGIRVAPEQVVWWRWKLATDMEGDLAMMSQEHPWLPEDAFQTFGDVFFKASLIRHLRDDLATAPTPKGYRYRWAKYLDETPVDPCEPLTPGAITVWEEPDPQGVYIVACHPAFSSTQTARDDVVQVWRAYPDALVQAAEYVLEGGGLTRHCAWAAMHLAGAYRMNRRAADVYFVMDVEMTGLAVLQEIKRYEDNNWGLAPRPDARDLRDLKGAIRHYYFRKPDTWAATAATEWKSQPSYRPWILNQLRDVVDNGQTTIRSPVLVDELATVRRGEFGDADAIAAGGNAGECRVIAMAMATESWLTTVIDEIRGRFPTKAEPTKGRHVGEMLVGNYLARLGAAGRTR